MALLILKLTLVPLVLAVITLAGRRWGPTVAGLLAGLPVVAGPIVLLLAHEQGVAFGRTAALAALAAIAGLLVFGVAYSHLAQRWTWPVALTGGISAWLLTAVGLLVLPTTLAASLAAALAALVLAPRLLPLPPPTPSPVTSRAATAHDLPWRMTAGALLTLTVTSLAATVGDTASGLLAAFPVLGTVLAVYTHRSRGAEAVAALYRGMVRGLYAFAAFFAALTLTLPHAALGTAAATAVLAALIATTMERFRFGSGFFACPYRRWRRRITPHSGQMAQE